MTNSILEKFMRTVMVSMLLLAGSAQAAGIPVTIDFDDTLPTVAGLTTYQEDGFTLNSNVAAGTLIDQNDVVRANLGIFWGGTTSQSLFWGADGSTSTISLTNDAGARFELLSLDASSLYETSSVLTLTGTLSGGGTVQQNLNLNNTLSTYNITGMSDIVALDISFDGSTYFAPFDLDNINMSVVPVPGAVWLFASALGLAGLRRKRRLS
jgi:hypothetical protein